MEITLSEHIRLCGSDYKQYSFGSRLFGTHNINSDFDYLRIYKWDSVFVEPDQTYLPNIHSFKYIDHENNTEYIWINVKQFYSNLFIGDGTIYSDIVIFSGEWDFQNIIDLCRTYRIIKSYCGVAKRELRNKGDKVDKKIKLAHRSLIIAQLLIDNKMPTISDIQNIAYDISFENLLKWESDLRIMATRLYESNELDNYPHYKSDDSLLQKMYTANNIRQFKF